MKALDAATRAMFQKMNAAGFQVEASKDWVTAFGEKTGETFTVRFADPETLADAMVRLADEALIDLGDG